jgi:hypothetical protein
VWLQALKTQTRKVSGYPSRALKRATPLFEKYEKG